MKKFLLVPMLAAALTFPLVAEEDTTTVEHVKSEKVAPPQQKLIDEVLTDYREGRYNQFLKSIDASYKEKSKNWEFNTALEERKKLSEMITDYQGPKGDVFKQEIAALHEKQNRELVEVCLNNPNEKISSEVRDMVFFSPTAHEQESLDYLHSLSQKFKGDGTTPLENKLINIDTEFWLKGLSLGVALTQGQVDQETFQKQYIVLQIEKMKQMKDACQGDLVDVKVKSYVDTAADILPKVKASASTRQYLTALGRGKVAPKNETEQAMQKIMAAYLQKEGALMEKHFPNQD
ncbi:MAG: hypothetical protein KDK64_01125 [Chlamydiia bacterium]|nr:hypothetical protein [Chlamydiia bacterium]